MTLLPILLKEFDIPELNARNLIVEWKLDNKIELGKMTRKQVICLNQMFKEAKLILKKFM
jgi:hypothetical protein